MPSAFDIRQFRPITVINVIFRILAKGYASTAALFLGTIPTVERGRVKERDLSRCKWVTQVFFSEFGPLAVEMTSPTSRAPERLSLICA